MTFHFPIPQLVSIASGFTHSCALSFNSYVYCFGQNTYGQLGDGTTTDRARPVLTATRLGS